MTIIYVTTGAWGSGTGAPISAAQVDGNFWDVDQRIVNLASDLNEGKRIDYVTYTNNSMTFHFTDATTQVIPLPVATFNYVGAWANDTGYIRGNLITANNGFYQVLEDHTTPSTPAVFDPNATDGTTAQNPLYELWIPLYGTLDNLTDVTITSVATGQIIVWNGTNWVNQSPTLDSLTDVVISSVATGQTIIWNGTNWVNQTPATATAPALDDLSDVALTTPTAGQVLSFDGTNWGDVSAVDLPIVNLGSASGSLTINLQTAEFVRIQATGNLTISGFTWPASSSGRFVRRVIEIINNASYTLAWPAMKWAGGTVPALTHASTDVYVIYTFDGGASVFGNVVGQGYA